MFVVDDLLLSPLTSLWWVFREIANTVDADLENQEDDLKNQLRDLYMQLETGIITEQAFDDAETRILDKLDALEDQAQGSAEE